MPTGRSQIMQIRVRLELKCFLSYKQLESHIIYNLITLTVWSLWENLKPRPSRNDLTIAWSIWQGLSLRFFCNDFTHGY